MRERWVSVGPPVPTRLALSADHTSMPSFAHSVQKPMLGAYYLQMLEKPKKELRPPPPPTSVARSTLEAQPALSLRFSPSQIWRPAGLWGQQRSQEELSPVPSTLQRPWWP